MSLPHQYKADTEAIFGKHLSHDDSINDRSAGAELPVLQDQTERLFEEAGEQFFQAGGMFRGIPKQLTPQQRRDCLPGAARHGCHARPTCLRTVMNMMALLLGSMHNRIVPSTVSLLIVIETGVPIC